MTEALTFAERAIYDVLRRAAPKFVSRDDLHRVVFGFVPSGRGSVPVHITRIRSKLGADAIETVYGHGYRLGSQAIAVDVAGWRCPDCGLFYVTEENWDNDFRDVGHATTGCPQCPYQVAPEPVTATFVSRLEQVAA